MTTRSEKKRMPWLEYNEALQELRSDSEIVVGTGAQATWRVRRADLMPRHFVVSIAGDRATIRPFSREAVVTVNGRQVGAGDLELNDRDVISAGSGDFHFWVNDPGESRSTVVKNHVAAHLIDLRGRSAHPLHRISTGLGRDESNSLVIDDDAASSFHAEVRREAGGHALRAADDVVVKLNGRPVSAPVLLAEGDQIEIANLVLRYSREPLPAGITEATRPSVTTTVSEIETLELVASHRRLPVGELSSSITLRTPMRAVAFVSSVIAAVAIATLVFLHRGP